MGLGVENNLCKWNIPGRREEQVKVLQGFGLRNKKKY
jgi:hypothetical protein